MVTQIWINIGSGNSLLPDGTNPLLEPMFTYHQRVSLAFTWDQFHKKCSQIPSVICIRRLYFWIYDHNPPEPMSWTLECNVSSMPYYLVKLYHHQQLTHWGQDKMAPILQTTFANEFSWIRMYEFCLRFHWSWFLRFESAIYQHWLK